MPDLLKLSLWVGLTAIIVGAICLIAVASANSGSRNIALATSALVAAIVAVGTQLWFELRASSRSDFFSVEYTIDRARPSIRQWDYSGSPSQRMGSEIRASELLSTKMPAKFVTDPAQVTSDLALFSLISYLGLEQYDWQLKRTVFRGSTMGTAIYSNRTSDPAECTEFSKEQLKGRLVEAQNMFAESEIQVIGASLCLPPKAVLNVTAEMVEIKTPYNMVRFTLTPSNAVSHMMPGSGGNVPLSGDGKSRYETRITGIESFIEPYWLRSQSREMKKYDDWAERLVSGVRVWFEGESGTSVDGV